MKRQSGIQSKILEPSGMSARGGRQASFLCGRGRSSAVRGSPDSLARKTQRMPVYRREYWRPLVRAPFFVEPAAWAFVYMRVQLLGGDPSK
jgi:hypothetical protein